MAQSNHVNRNQFQYTYVRGLSQFGPSLGKMPFGFNLLLLRPKIMTLVIGELTSRLEEVQNLCSLFRILCRPALDLESKPHHHHKEEWRSPYQKDTESPH